MGELPDPEDFEFEESHNFDEYEIEWVQSDVSKHIVDSVGEVLEIETTKMARCQCEVCGEVDIEPGPKFYIPMEAACRNLLQASRVKERVQGPDIEDSSGYCPQCQREVARDEIIEDWGETIGHHDKCETELYLASDVVESFVKDTLLDDTEE